MFMICVAKKSLIIRQDNRLSMKILLHNTSLDVLSYIHENPIIRQNNLHSSFIFYYFTSHCLLFLSLGNLAPNIAEGYYQGNFTLYCNHFIVSI